VPAGGQLFRVHGAARAVDEDAVRAALIVSLEPTLDADVAYGIRLLVDIAERSLADSPFQDPTTAVQAIDRLHDILRQLARRPFPDGRHRDDAGRVRLTVRTMELGGVRASRLQRDPSGRGRPAPGGASAESGSHRPQSVAPADRTEILDLQLDLLTTATEAALSDDRDVALALNDDREGIGAAAGSLDG
jgi:hypothetical protein